MVLDMAKPKNRKHIAWNAWKRCCKEVDSQGGHFAGIHDRFLRDPGYCESQLAIGWTEQKCSEVDELGQEDHTYPLTPEEKKRYQGQRYLTLTKAGKNGPVRLRSDFRGVVSIKNRLHRESGEQVEERLHPNQRRRWHSSSSALWWDKSGWNWIFFLLQLVSFTIDSDPLEPTVCVDRYTSHVFLLMHFAHLITCISNCMAQDELCLCACASFHLHAIHDVCLIVCWLRPRSVLLLFLSVVYLFSSTLYLHSAQHFLSNVNSVEGINHCAFAQRGGLPHGDIPSSHTSRDPPATTYFKFSFYFRTPMLTRCEQVSDVLEMITSWVCRKRLQPSSLSERV